MCPRTAAPWPLHYQHHHNRSHYSEPDKSHTCRRTGAAKVAWNTHASQQRAQARGWGVTAQRIHPKWPDGKVRDGFDPKRPRTSCVQARRVKHRPMGLARAACSPHPALRHLPTRCRQTVSGVSGNVCGGIKGGQTRRRFEKD